MHRLQQSKRQVIKYYRSILPQVALLVRRDPCQLLTPSVRASVMMEERAHTRQRRQSWHSREISSNDFETKDEAFC